jgi:hypothetical protein
LQTYKKEFELLKFCFHGAKIFFRDANDVQQNQSEKEKTDPAPATTPDTQNNSSNAPPPPPLP